jgi:ABC-type transport system involved in cytochrome c biogenesis permease subunit
MFRWFQAGFSHPPFTNLYESLLFFSWGIALFYLIMERRYRFKAGGAFILPVAVSALGAAVLNPQSSKDIQNLLPALQSHWLHAHVAVAAMAYAAFVAAFGASLMFLIKDKVDKGSLLAWANAFMAFMLVISDRGNIVSERIFALSLVDAAGRVTLDYFPVAAAGRLLLIATGYFVLAGILYRLGVPGRREKEPESTIKTARWAATLFSLAPLVTFLGVVSILLGMAALLKTANLDSQQLASMIVNQNPLLASAILEQDLSLALFANPFKIIILVTMAFAGTVSVIIDRRYQWIQELLPPAETLDAISHTIITIGFPLMTMVIVTGAVWAKKTFGHYWQWDPKETASLICWLI